MVLGTLCLTGSALRFVSLAGSEEILQLPATVKHFNQQLAGVLSAVDYNSENALGTREHKNAILRDLLEDFEPLDLRPSAIEVKEGQVPADVIGDAYEYMIGQFASMAGKKAGSFSCASASA